jgi:hypothetical protein
VLRKGIAAALLALAFISACFLALADTKSFDITINQDGTGDFISVNSSAVANGTLYLDADGLYAWEPETGHTRELTFDGGWVYRLIGGGEGLFMLDTIQGALVPIAVNGNLASAGTLIQLEWSIFTRDLTEGETFNCQVVTAFVANDTLYLQIRDYESGDWNNHLLFRFDLETGEADLLHKGRDLYNLTPYKAGKLLAIRYDQSHDFASGLADESLRPAIAVFDPDLKAFTEVLATLDGMNYGGLAYNDKTDTLYLSTGGTLLQKTPGNDFELLNYLTISSVFVDTGATLIGDAYYVLQGFNVICIRSLNPVDRPNNVFKIARGEFDTTARAAYLAFTKKYPEVATARSDYDYFAGAEGIAIDMRTATASDVYAINRKGVMEALINKGYCVDLTEHAAIFDVVKAMYPHMTACLFKDGRLCAVPYIIYTGTTFGYSPRILAEMGLTEADLPETLLEFIDFISDWADSYSFDYPDYSLLDLQFYGWRFHLLDIIFEQQIAYCGQQGIPMTFDTEAVRALLNKLDAMDAAFNKLDPKEDPLVSGIIVGSPNALFTMAYRPIEKVSEHYGDGFLALPMYYIEGVPMFIPLHMNTLVINPASENKETALNFLAEMLANLDVTAKFITMPDYNEPLKKSMWQQNLADLEQNLKSHKDILNIVGEEYKKDFEANIVRIEADIAWEKEHPYDIATEQIEAYRLIAERVIPLAEEYAAFNDSENLRSLRNRYEQRQITAEQFIIETEKVLQKMRVENQ